ncbi:4a-hydroxytetrahydrobiopterin dehydratase [Thioclava kandeliae]|uniref:Putative pterin-4-alpha-carbinolamine dehydratase n=1 Tax=Thioclava kandeliae TaxID=3070818 RepID=A0ABV1SDH2_9RHOB
MATKLNQDERASLMPLLKESGWRMAKQSDAIRKVWKFENFEQAWGFMAQAALLAEKMDHHPDWRNVYNVVDIELSTHSCKGLSILDFELARALDAIPHKGKVLFQSPLPEREPGQDEVEEPDPRPDLGEDLLD